MTKPLTEMTNEELWALFPISLKEHDPVWRSYYEEEAELLVRAFGVACVERISHIGSTSVPGLLAKPTVDILLEVTKETADETIVRTAEKLGYLFAPQPNNPPPHMMFMKGYTPKGFAENVVHLHVRYAGDWDELYFRDYLRQCPEIAVEYGRLKMNLSERYRHDRDGYTEAKTAFVRRITERARESYDKRYWKELR